VSTGLRAFGSPSRYIQGPDALDCLEEYTCSRGKKLVALIDRFLYDAICARLEHTLSGGNMEYATLAGGGECSLEEISRISAFVEDSGADIIVGIGGGKTHDVAKYVANALKLFCVIVPTSASTDAPTSAMSVLYKEDGSYLRSVCHANNPDLILVDSKIILTAPIRLFAAGIGDALSTYYEASACEKSGAKNYVGSGFSRCRAGLAIARECYDVLMRDAVKALEDVRAGRLSESVENVIEANTLLSGLGFENTGCAAAHALHTGLHIFPKANKYLHGEMVAFGVLFQAVMEQHPPEEINRLAAFLVSCNLPVTLAQFEVDADESTVWQIVRAILSCNSGIEAEPFPVTEKVIFDSLMRADALGRRYLEEKSLRRDS